jgi:hypothetical protein
MTRSQVFSPEDLDLMRKVFRRACDELPEVRCEKQKNQIAKAIVITYRTKRSEDALAAAAKHLVALKYLN